MEESEDNMSTEDVNKFDSSSAVKKPKKRSLVERELETNMTARMTSPAGGEGFSTSRYGRARRLKTDTELIESQKILLASITSPTDDNSPVQTQSPVYRMHASNSPHKAETPNKAPVTHLDNQIDSIYQENISLSRFSDDASTPSPAKKFPKVYIRKDLIQNREEDETIMLIQHLFSPSKSGSKSSNTPSAASVQSTENNYTQNGHVDNSSVVKTLDFDNKSKKKEDKESKITLSKNELFDIEATCPYQVGDLAWARVGTFPFWPCIVTRDPYSEMFVKKKLFGRVTHDILHVTFLGDNGRRSWIVDNMLRSYLGQQEFLSTREKFTPEDKKKDPRLYAAFFVSEKKQVLWNMSVQEAETLLREPKQLRIDIFNDMLWKSRASKKPLKSGKISSRTDSDVSLSESLYDSLFSEKEEKAEDTEHPKKPRNKSFDVSEVVTACLDNMAAKAGITKIQRQSHMDRWLQKAKSKTPEKTQTKPAALKLEKSEKPPNKLNRKSNSKINAKPVPSTSNSKSYKFRKGTESQSKLTTFVNQNDSNSSNSTKISNNKTRDTKPDDVNSARCEANVDNKSNSSQDISTTLIIDDDDDKTTITPKDEPIVQNTGESINVNIPKAPVELKHADSVSDSIRDANIPNPTIMDIKNNFIESVNQETATGRAEDIPSNEEKSDQAAPLKNETIDISAIDNTTLNVSQTTNDAKSQNDATDLQLMEPSKDTSNMPVESKCEMSEVGRHDSSMEVDENTSDVETVYNKGEKLNLYDPANNSVMEVDNFDSEVNEDTRPNSKTVSNKSVGCNYVSDLKEAQNDVTIEVSVTEKKNDVTVNKLPWEGEQKNNNKQNPSQLTQTKVDTIHFLGENLNKDVVETNEVIAPENSSTPEKFERQTQTTKIQTKVHKINEKSSNVSTKEFDAKSNITFSNSNNISRNSEKAEELKDDHCNISVKNVQIEACASIEDGNNDESMTLDCKRDELNESGNSESILQVSSADPEIEKGGDILETSFTGSTQSESILDNSQIDESAQQNNVIEETAENLGNERGLMTEVNEKGSTRQYVESPTFTQLLDSEEFFCDVDEQHSSSEKLDSGNSKRHTKPQEITVKEVEIVEDNKTVDNFLEDDDTSEDEPSPEYESLDDELTEDFRKHMMSIESNVKDKKDEEQIVKICNEIAQKAKLSPTKYNQDKEMTKPNDKIETNLKDAPIISLKDNIGIKQKAYDTIHKEKANKSQLDKYHIKVGNDSTDLLDRLESSIEKQNKSNALSLVTKTDLNQTDKNTKTDIKIAGVAENFEDNKVQNKDTTIKINGDVTLHEISETPKVIYRTRSTKSNVTKECTIPDIEIKLPMTEQGRKSCKYDPKVVIIRLERDKTDYSLPKHSEEDESKNNNKSQVSVSDSCNENHIDPISKEDDKNDSRTTIENEDDKSKRRKSVKDKEDNNKNKKYCLTLRRKRKPTENSIQNQPKIKDGKSENIMLKAFKKEETVTTTIETAKQVEIESNTSDTGKAYPVIVNGYRHNLDRKFTDTPDSADTDFDVDAASLNSEDSEVSLPNSTESKPKRNLRSRPERTLEFALQSPEFLKYLEVRQDYLMDLHPELNEDEVVAYIHKSWEYEEELKSVPKIIVDVRKQETPSRNKKSKKSEPRNRIKEYFCEKYEKSKKTIDFVSEPGAIAHSNNAVEQQKPETYNVEESANKTELPVKEQKRSKSPEYADLTSDANNDASLEKDKCNTETVSVESIENLTPRRSSRSRTTPKSLNSEIYDLKHTPTFEEMIKKGDLANKSMSQEKIQKEQDVKDTPTPKEEIEKKQDLKEEPTPFPSGKVQKEQDLKENSSEEKIKNEPKDENKPSPKEKIQIRRDLKDKPTPEEKIQKERVLHNKTALKKTSEKEQDIDSESIDSEDSEIPLRQLRSKVLQECNVDGSNKDTSLERKVDEATTSKETIEIKGEADETVSSVSDNEPLVKQKQKVNDKNALNDPAFLQYLELKQDQIMDENPQLTQDEIIQYLYKSWLYDEKAKSALNMNNELEKLATSTKDKVAPAKKVRQKPKVEKQTDDSEIVPKEKPRRRIAQPFYNENYSDIEDELEMFEIFKMKKSAITVVSKAETDKAESPKSSKQNGQAQHIEIQEIGDDDVGYVDDTEIYFQELTKPKPSVFKGLIREKVCDICEYAGSLVKCKVCYGMFHPDCVDKQAQQSEQVKESPLPLKGRKKKRKLIRKSKNDDSESQSDEKSLDMSIDTSIEDVVPADLLAIDAEYFESQIEAKMKEIVTSTDINYDSYSSDDGVDWEDSVPGKCEIVHVKLKRRDPPVDYSDFKCNDCQKHDVPVCFVCKSAISKTDVKMRQKCHVAHCHKYYHLECLDHWPQTQFVSGEPSRNNKKKEFSEALTCPRHVCHTCVSDDPRGCKTRFSGDKLAKCVRCPATYHSFNKCLPAGSQVLTASHIICPRHSEQKAGKIPCHVNTGWCFICALGGSLICCEYCPTSFHAECLNIKPPEGNYMCEDCETGRLPLYGEMVWVKLGQYRWWPGIILHPSEIPENIMAAKHELGDFVVRFFGQYDHYWVNRGRVFPYQEGDSGRISSQKSKINEDFICAIEHAQRAFSILKNAEPDEEESLDIASSLLPPHYVKLRSNKPSGALCGKRTEDPALSLTQCECDPALPDPCGPYSHCLNRMLLTECGPTCRAGERCRNRAFERRLYPRLAPYRTPQRGWGLRTLQDIRAGQFVIEYVGELIDEAECRRRMRRKHEVRDENFYFLTLDKERMIDAGPKGNVARFMNHCCEPNCETQKWTVLGDVRVGLFALTDIPANSELTFNYNLECAGSDKKRCLCGAKRCSGYIGAKPKQDDSQSKKGKDRKLKRPHNKKKKSEEPPPSKIKKKLGRPPKPKELTDLEKDVLIIKNATTLSEEIKIEDRGLKKKITLISSEQGSICNAKEEPKSLKRKRISISTEEGSICNEQEPCVKKQKCVSTEVGD